MYTLVKINHIVITLQHIVLCTHTFFMQKALMACWAFQSVSKVTTLDTRRYNICYLTSIQKP